MGTAHGLAADGENGGIGVVRVALRPPGEDRDVKVPRAGEVGGGQLVPGEGPGLVYEAGTGVVPGLPQGKDRTGRVLRHGEPPGGEYLHRADQQLAPVVNDLGRGRIYVGHADVHRPMWRTRVGLGADPGYQVVPQAEHAVPAGLRAGVEAGHPAKDLTVKPGRGLRVGRAQIDPARCAGRIRLSFSHELSSG